MVVVLTSAPGRVRRRHELKRQNAHLTDLIALFEVALRVIVAGKCNCGHATLSIVWGSSSRQRVWLAACAQFGAGRRDSREVFRKGYFMMRRFLPTIVLALASFSLLMANGYAQADADQPSVDDQSQAAPPQPQASEQPNANADDQSSANDEQEAEGQIVPAPPVTTPEQPGQAQANENTPDPPARAARLQYFTGSVSIQPQGKGDWANAELNRPLTNSDNIWADKNSRAEISVGSGLIRIDSESSLTLTRIAENSVQLELHQGALSLHVRKLYNNEVYEVDTPNQAFTVSQPGDFRFNVDSNADTTEVIVWRGQGQATGNGPAVTVHQNEQATFKGNSISGQVHAADEPDSFDQWARSRDERMDNSQSARYVSPDVPGYEDLDEYGTWKETDDYGEIWVPGSVAVGWAPYRFGHWIWVAPWGWTWVDDAPWGYAPFHYGRWVFWGGAWGWAPGPIYVRPYYAPALVAWFGGPRFGFGFGFGGGFGWCPLGFGEPFVPWYHVSRGYFGRVNITNTRITNVRITNVYNNNFRHGRPIEGGFHNNIRYANMHQPNGFTAVSRNTLTSGQQVGRNTLRVSPNQMSRMTPVRSLGAAPGRSAELGGSRASVTPPARSFARPTMSRATEASAGRGGFGRAPETFSRPASPIMNRAGSPTAYRGAMGSRSVPRPPSASMSRGPQPQFGNRGAAGFGGGRGEAQPTPRAETSVPRPPNASRSYSAPESRGNERSLYGRPTAGDGGGNYGRPTPSYGRSMPSYRGGNDGGRASSSSGGSRAPSYEGGRSSGGSGGGHTSGGGGGHPSGGGGGRSSGGGGGGGHSGGGHH